MALTTINVKSSPYNAVGDGVTNDTTALQSAFAALVSAGGGVLYHPPGTYLVNPAAGYLYFVPVGLSVVFMGDGQDVSIIKHNHANGQAIYQTGLAKLTVKDLGFDMSDNGGSTAIFTVGSRLRVRDCKFTGIDLGFGISAQRVNSAKIRNCLFEANFPAGQTVRQGTALQLLEGCYDSSVESCEFRGMYQHIMVTGQLEDIGGRITIRGCHFDGMWFLYPTRTKTTGGFVTGTATYADGSITASVGSFPDAIPDFTTIRALVPKATGTVNFCYGTSLDANSGIDFTALDIQRGDFLYTSTTMGIVTCVESALKIHVEQWLSRTTLQPITQPSNSTSFTVARFVVSSLNPSGRVSDSVLNTTGWLDTVGNRITGDELNAVATIYEVCINHPNYQGVHAEEGITGVREIDNVHLRSWSDQASVFGKHSQITNNWIFEGQDTGITCNGDDSLVTGNFVRRQGARGGWVTGIGSIATNNVFCASPWIQNVGDDGYDSQLLFAGDESTRRTQLGACNSFNGEEYSFNRVAISYSSSDLLLGLNISRGHRLASVTAYGENAKSKFYSNNFTDSSSDNAIEGKIRHLNDAVAVTYVLSGLTAPSENIEASNGSWYVQKFSTGVELIWFKSNGQWKLSTSAALRSPLT